MINSEYFYVIAHEAGFHVNNLPTWSDRVPANLLFDTVTPNTIRKDLPKIPGAFQLLNVLSETECQRFINIAEHLGFNEDSPVSLPHDIRHNENVNWVVSENIDSTIWNRSTSLIQEQWHGQIAHGLNARFRFYKYNSGDYFKPHSDGSWPGSRVIDGVLVADAYEGMCSLYTYLLFLSDDYDGGQTQFMVSKNNPSRPARSNEDSNVVSVQTPRGGALCFPHGSHPLHCIHSSEKITRGKKYIIRTDILFGNITHC